MHNHARVHAHCTLQSHARARAHTHTHACAHTHTQFFLDTKLNLLLVALPFAIVSKAVGWGDAATFTLSMLALCPLAEVRRLTTTQEV